MSDPILDPRRPLRDAGLDSLRRNWWLMLVIGILLILGGIGAIVLPVWASLAVTITVGFAMGIAGIAKLIHAFRCRGWRGWAWHVVSGLLYLAGGALLLFDPLAGMVSLTIVMIALIATDSILRIFMALRIRPDRGWGWMLIGGIVGLAIAAAMAAFLPWLSLTLLGVFAGVALIFEGWGFIWFALAARDGGTSQHAVP